MIRKVIEWFKNTFGGSKQEQVSENPAAKNAYEAYGMKADESEESMYTEEFMDDLDAQIEKRMAEMPKTLRP